MTWYHVNPDGSYHEVTIEETGGNIFQPIEERQLALDEVAPGITVSTVFLGIDHSFGQGPPVLWETMVFSSDYPEIDQDNMMDRYTSREAALVGHAAMVDAVRAYLARVPATAGGDDGCEAR